MKSFLFLVCAIFLVGLLAAGFATTVAGAVASPRTDPALSGPWLLKTGMKNNETLYVISNDEPTITFTDDGTFTVFGGCNYYKGRYFLFGETADLRKNITLGPMYGISDPGPAITFGNDGTFTLFSGCSCYKENRILTGQVTDFRKPVKLIPVPQTAIYCVQINNTEKNYLQILRAAETYHIRNNIEYMNLRTAAGEQLFFRSGNL
jgi:heat shock protein HslJ